MKLWVVYEDYQDGELNHEYFIEEEGAWESYYCQQACRSNLNLVVKCIQTED